MVGLREALMWSKHCVWVPKGLVLVGMHSSVLQLVAPKVLNECLKVRLPFFLLLCIDMIY